MSCQDLLLLAMLCTWMLYGTVYGSGPSMASCDLHNLVTAQQSIGECGSSSRLGTMSLWTYVSASPLEQTYLLMFPSSYRSLKPRTRLGIGLGVVAYALIAQRLSDQAERVFGYTPTEDDKRRLHDAIPRVTPVEKGGPMQ